MLRGGYTQESSLIGPWSPSTLSEGRGCLAHTKGGGDHGQQNHHVTGIHAGGRDGHGGPGRGGILTDRPSAGGQTRAEFRGHFHRRPGIQRCRVFRLETHQNPEPRPHGRRGGEAHQFLFRGTRPHAVPRGNWKLRLETTLRDEDIYRRIPNRETPMPEALYNLEADPGEQKPVRKDHPDIVKRLDGLAEKARLDLGDARTGVTGKNVRPTGTLEDVQA